MLKKFFYWQKDMAFGPRNFFIFKKERKKLAKLGRFIEHLKNVSIDNTIHLSTFIWRKKI